MSQYQPRESWHEGYVYELKGSFMTVTTLVSFL